MEEISEEENQKLLAEYEETLNLSHAKSNELMKWAAKLPEDHELYKRAKCDAAAIKMLLIGTDEGDMTIKLIKEHLGE